jgi:sec-independent protein translocase protein TatB
MPMLSPLELLVVAVVALIVFGPQRLPEIARTVGRWLSEMRRMASDVRAEFESGLETDDSEPVGDEPIGDEPADPGPVAGPTVPAPSEPAPSEPDPGEAEPSHDEDETPEPAPAPAPPADPDDPDSGER